MIKEPIVSVLMTAFNREKYISEAIKSVLDSSLKDFELIVVDDCSKDRTFEIAKSYEMKDLRIKVYQNQVNLGDYLNRNKAASYATGKYIKYLDSDDLIYPHGLEVFVASMEKFPEAKLGLCSSRSIETPYPTLISNDKIFMEHYSGYFHFFRAPGSAIINREAFWEVGGFSGKRLIGDTELWLKFSLKYPLVKINKDLYWCRVHLNQEGSIYRNDMEREGQKILNEYLSHNDNPLSKTQMSLIKSKRIKLQLKSVLSRWVNFFGLI
jgi:glycosyltransferase involved in cell wall biosynthesis